MTWTLVRKEVRQHWLALVLVSLVALAGYLLIAVTRLANDPASSGFESLRVFLTVMGVMAPLVICQRLVVAEYQARTQLFLEALPVARWHMVSVKYGLGLLVVLGLVGVAYALAFATAGRREALTPLFVLILLGRGLSVVWCSYNFFFLMGLWGRYRLVFCVAVLILLGVLGKAVETQSDRRLRFENLSPTALLDGRFPYERETPPWLALSTTWSLGGTFLILALVLSLVREGSVAALLAEKMSHREKVTIAAMLVALLYVGTLSFENYEKRHKTPFDLLEAVTVERAGVVVKVAGEGQSGGAAQTLAAYLGDELAAARVYLGLERLPPVYLTRRRDLDVQRYERGELEKVDGLLVQANFGDPAWDRQRFLAWLLRELLITRSEGRVKLEPKCWILDGFGWFWADRAQLGAPLARNKPLALRALYGAETGFAAGDLRRWWSVREKVGGDIAEGLAWSGLKTLARRQGPERCQRFLRAALATTAPQDFRALWRERVLSLERLLRDQAGTDLSAFLAQWRDELAGARRALSNEVARLPRLRGQTVFVALSAESRTVQYRVTMERPPSPETRYSFLYHLLPPFDEEVSPQAIQRELNSYSQKPAGELPESYPRGARLYWTFALEVPALGCEVISGWRREEVQ